MKDFDLSNIKNEKVKDRFLLYPSNIRIKLLYIRQLILDIADQNEEISSIEETVKWGEPSYLASNKVGSTIRIDWKKSSPEYYFLYFNCKTSIIAIIKNLYGDLFKYSGNRAIMFHIQEKLPLEELSEAIKIGLLYKKYKKQINDLYILKQP